MNGARGDDLRLLAFCHYPTELRPVRQVFVRATLRELARLSVGVTVVAPESVFNLARPSARFRLGPRFERRDDIDVHRPRYLSYSNLTLPGGIPTYGWTVNAHAAAALREARGLEGRADLCFGHFLYPHGFSALRVAEARGIPAVLSLGESSFHRYEAAFDADAIKALLARFAGIVANSEPLQAKALSYGVPPTRVQVLPNGVDEEHFHPRDRQEARRQCGLPQGRPIVAFLGQFIERKGPLRVMQAIRSRAEIGAIFLGSGPQAPSGPQVLFRGTVAHEQVPVWLSAADLLVLPTKDEGCSNAVIEALACGLPVISSDRPFNRAIVDEEVAVLVEPGDVEALRSAVSALVDDPARRSALSRAGLERARRFRLGDRAKRIKSYLTGLVHAAPSPLRAASGGRA